MRKINKAILALIIANIIWGAASPIFKWSLINVHPITLSFMRFGLPALLFLPFAWGHLRMEKKDLLKLTTLSIVGMSLAIPIYFYGLKLSSSINAPIIGSSGPIFLMIGAAIFLKDRPTKKIIAGTLVSLAGVLIIILQPILEEGLDGTVTGNMLFVAATIGGVIFTILLKELVPHYRLSTLLFWMFTIATLALSPFVVVESHIHGFLPNLNIQGLVGIYFGAILSSALAYFLFAYSLKKVVASKTGIFTYIDPVAAVVIAVPLLGEELSMPFILGSILVFGGIYISEKRIHWHPLHLLKDK